MSEISDSASSPSEFVTLFFFGSAGKSGDVSSRFLVAVTTGVAPLLDIIGHLS